ncbi:DUF1763-domain-containing protein [Sarocladium strictum]
MATAVASGSTGLDIVHAYRRILRATYQAVQYSSPARFIVRDQVRAAFRESPESASSSSTATANAPAFDPQVAKRTAWFLEAAARERGVEHRVVKNLVKIRYHKNKATEKWKMVLHSDMNKRTKLYQQGAYDHFDMTVAMMNKSLGIALR